MSLSGAKKTSVLSYSSYREFLRDYVRSAKADSSTWSYANWARRLGVSKSTLVMIVQGQRHPGDEMATKIGTHIGFDESELTHFKKLVESEKKFPDPIARLVFMRSESDGATEQKRQWLFLVLLDLCEVAGFQNSPTWIRERILVLVTETEISNTLSSMIERGFIVEENGKFRANREKVSAELGGMLSEKDIRRFHEDGGHASVEALLKTDRTERVFATSVLRVSTSRIEEARAILQRTQSELSRLLESQEGDSIYELHLHLFPLTKK